MHTTTAFRSLRRAAGTGVLAALTATSLLAPGAPAPARAAAAQPQQPAAAKDAGTRALASAGRFRIVNRLSGKCLVVWGSGDGAAITQVGCNSADTGQWWHLDTGGVGTVSNERTGRCLDLWGQGASNAQTVFTWTCRPGFGGQLWRTVNRGGQYWELHPYTTDKCLDLAADNRSDGAVVQQWGCNWGANDNQQWWLG